MRGDAHRRGVCLSLLCREGGEAVPFRELGLGGLPLGLKSLAGGGQRLDCYFFAGAGGVLLEAVQAVLGCGKLLAPWHHV